MNQIQALKSQIENTKLQIDNIVMLNNNMFMMNNQSEQILNLSIQLFNAGIQAFNIGKNISMMMNIQKFYEQLRKISEQINYIINGNDMQQMQQQIMIQQQMMLQQQMMMQQQNYNNQGINIMEAPKILQGKHKNILFENHNPGRSRKRNICAKYGTKVKEVLNQYLDKEYGSNKEKVFFLYNGSKIDLNEDRFVETFFKFPENPIVTVLESN